MRRVLVLGCGAGKTRLARRIAGAEGLPLVDLDAHYWRPGWRPTPPDAWRARVRELVCGSEWVMDGNYGSTLDLRIPAADTVVFLDRPTAVCLWRVMRRRVRYHGRSRPSLAEGCPERLTPDFLRWIWEYRRRRRPGVLRALAAVSGDKEVYVLRTEREIRAFAERLGNPGTRRACRTRSPAGA